MKTIYTASPLAFPLSYHIHVVLVSGDSHSFLFAYILFTNIQLVNCGRCQVTLANCPIND